MASPDRYSVLITANGAAVHHESKLNKLICECSQAAEAVASERVRQRLLAAREVQRCGGLGGGPSLLLTDNMSNKQLATNTGTPARSRHQLRRFRRRPVHQRV